MKELSKENEIIDLLYKIRDLIGDTLDKEAPDVKQFDITVSSVDPGKPRTCRMVFYA